ncbi:hypothetical protein [Vogesella sp. LIG4]|uniref:hypothetical protein n=1 Tax=Vogesella sp. LIG4 TaxID=1192162 RepID=UPI0008201696|nr:hypothetical protein [Vogesella sp. LIG4]SCK27736.1 hypothetical protein PSELUDRAFT_3379 [Vogesella sp. LIG4]
MKLSRRQLIRTGLLGGVALVLGGRLARTLPAPGFAANLADRELIAALGRGMLGPLPASGALSLADNVLSAIAGLPPAVQAELRQLFDLLHSLPGRRLLAGVATPWQQADAAAMQGFLQRWRHSRFVLLRSGYQALHSLLYAGWYGAEASWLAIDYRLPAMMKGLL